MKKIKVLHLIKTLDLGGAETNLLNLVRATDASRFDIHVGYSSGGPIEPRFRECGVRLFKYADRAHRVKSLATFVLVLRIARYIRKHGIQIVHTHKFNSHVWGSLAAKISGAKLVEHVHDFRYMDPAEYRRRRGETAQFKFAKRLKNLSDRVIVLTRQNADYLVREGLYPLARIRRIENGIPFLARPARSASRAETKAKFGLPADARVVLTAARMAPEKNVELLLRMAPRVHEAVPGVQFLISGDGPLLGSLRAKSQSDPALAECVKFIGYHNDVFELLSITDIFLLPSFLELHSIAVLEAMSVGVPVVISQGVGCNDDFIRNWENGVLVDPFSSTGWAESLTKLLGDDALRRRIGEAGRATCLERFDIRRAAREKETLYAELVG